MVFYAHLFSFGSQNDGQRLKICFENTIPIRDASARRVLELWYYITSIKNVFHSWFRNDSRVANIYRPDDIVLGRSYVRMTIEKTTAIKPTIFWRRSERAEVDRFFIAPTTGVPYRQFRYSCARRTDVASSSATVCPGGFDASVFRLVDIIPIIYHSSMTKKKKNLKKKGEKNNTLWCATSL